MHWGNFEVEKKLAFEELDYQLKSSIQQKKDEYADFGICICDRCGQNFERFEELWPITFEDLGKYMSGSFLPMLDHYGGSETDTLCAKCK